MATKKETARLVLKCLILLITISIGVFVTIFAWFSDTTSADANGISIITEKNSGLESKILDNKTGTWTDYNVKHDMEIDSLYPLISGNGKSFILPSLNRTTGNPLISSGTNPDANWIIKRDAVANQDYLEQDIVFRSTEALNVKLSKSSKVTSDDIENHTLNHKSDFGDFTKDYIAGASRVAFFEVNDVTNTETLKYIWVPNEKYELTGASNFSEVEPTTTTIGTGTDVTGGTPTNYYVWWNGTNNYSGGSYDAMVTYCDNMQKSPLMDKGTYYYVKMTAPPVGVTNMGDRAMFITNGSTIQYQNQGSDYVIANKFDIGGWQIRGQFQDTDGKYVTVEFKSDDYNIAFRKKSGGGYDYVKASEKVYVSPHSTSFDYYLIINKTSNNVTEVLIDGHGTTETVTTYELEDNSYVVFTGTTPSVSSEMIARTKSTVAASNVAITTESGKRKLYTPDYRGMMTVIKSGDNGYSFKMLNNNTYLYVNSSGELGLTSNSAEKTIFALTASANYNWPLITYNNQYLSFDGTNFYMSATPQGNIGIFTGDTYTMLTNSTRETFKYYDASASQQKVRTLSGYYLTGQLNAAPTITTLTKASATDEYYTAHIKVVVWAEGTDREAKIPLAGGNFYTYLNFSGSKITS